jgi:hypothetical protein
MTGYGMLLWPSVWQGAPAGIRAREVGRANDPAGCRGQVFATLLRWSFWIVGDCVRHDILRLLFSRRAGGVEVSLLETSFLTKKWHCPDLFRNRNYYFQLLTKQRIVLSSKGSMPKPLLPECPRLLRGVEGGFEFEWQGEDLSRNCDASSEVRSRYGNSPASTKFLRRNLATFEAGIPGFESGIWSGLLAPAGTPQPIIDKLARAANEAIQSSDVQRRLQPLGIEVIGGMPDDFGRYMDSELKHWSVVVSRAGLAR